MEKQVEELVGHATTHRFWQEDTHNMSASQILKKFSNRAICPRCEKFAYRDKGWSKGKYARCPACGWAGRTITIDEYITSRLYK